MALQGIFGKSPGGWIGPNKPMLDWGNGSDGDLVVSADTTLTPDADNIIVKNYANLTIDAGFTLSPSAACKYMLLKVRGNLTVNGTIENHTPYNGSPTDDVHFGGGLAPQGIFKVTEQIVSPDVVGLTQKNILDAIFSENEPTDLYTRQTGPAAGIGATGYADGGDGTNGGTGQVGSGGGGGNGDDYSDGADGHTGNGWGSGGGGGGGASHGDGDIASIHAGGDGGDAVDAESAQPGGGGGGGFPAGAAGTRSDNSNNTENGTIGVAEGGGIVIIIVQGTITIGAAGKIDVSGGNGGKGGDSDDGLSTGGGGGGGAGGGVVIIVAGISITNSGSIDVSGGNGGALGDAHTDGKAGGDGGDGDSQTHEWA